MGIQLKITGDFLHLLAHSSPLQCSAGLNQLYNIFLKNSYFLVSVINLWAPIASVFNEIFRRSGYDIRVELVFSKFYCKMSCFSQPKIQDVWKHSTTLHSFPEEILGWKCFSRHETFINQFYTYQCTTFWKK